ncbi:MAG: hypothetical protein WD874_00255 [Parcubacteria group bacterium]
MLPAITAPAPAPVEAKAEVAIPLKKEVKSEDYEPMTDSKNVKKFVEDYFADIPLMVQIAGCESRFRQYKNGNVIRGEINNKDVGVMQVNEHYHAATALKLGIDIYSIDGNVAYARYLYEKEGARPWMSSSACWAKFKESEIARR